MHLAWAGFKLMTLVVIANDCLGNCKSNYHTITTMTVPVFVREHGGLKSMNHSWCFSDKFITLSVYFDIQREVKCFWKEIKFHWNDWIDFCSFCSKNRLLSFLYETFVTFTFKLFFLMFQYNNRAEW